MLVAGRASPRPSRPSRRLPRWLLLGVALSLLVLMVNSVMASGEGGPDRRLVYLDEVRPAIDRSSRQGADLDDLRGRGAEIGRDGLRARVERLA
ncbi:MAG: hypothetical protein ACRD0F_03810, partial [Acidimicrobiales bacterium]